MCPFQIFPINSTFKKIHVFFIKMLILLNWHISKVILKSYLATAFKFSFELKLCILYTVEKRQSL